MKIFALTLSMSFYLVPGGEVLHTTSAIFWLKELITSQFGALRETYA